MATTRQNILETIKTDLEGIIDTETHEAVFKYVSVARIPPTELDTVPLPACFIYSESEKRITDERSVMGRETWEWIVVLEVWALDKDLENLLEYIHETLYADYRFGNYAQGSHREGVDFFTIDTTMRTEGMVIPYNIQYCHVAGAM